MPLITDIQDAIGAIDGVNVDFQTPEPYSPGTLRVLYNGQWKNAEDDDGFIETGSDTFQMKEPPFAGDDLMVAYKEA